MFGHKPPRESAYLKRKEKQMNFWVNSRMCVQRAHPLPSVSTHCGDIDISIILGIGKKCLSIIRKLIKTVLHYAVSLACAILW